MGKHFRKVVTGTLGAGLVLSAFSSASAATENLNTHWAGDQIERWVAIGNLGGYSDGTLKPDGSITRAEFISLVNRTFGSFTSSVPTVVETTYGSGFKDLSSGNWAYNDIMTAVQAGYLSGYADGTIRPNQEVTRQEAAAIIAKVIGLTPGSASSLRGYSDYDEIASWSRGSVAAVIAQGYMNGYPDGTFKPEKELTRAEAVVILDAASGYTLDDTDNIIAPDENTGSVIDDTYGEDDNVVLPPADTDDQDSADVDEETNEDAGTDSEPAEDTDTSSDADDTAAGDNEDAADTDVTAPDVDAVQGGDNSITGTADPGVTVRVYSENDTLLGSGTADEDGEFAVSVTEVTEGAVLTIIAEDADGNESTEVEITVDSEDDEDSTSTDDEDSTTDEDDSDNADDDSADQ